MDLSPVLFTCSRVLCILLLSYFPPRRVWPHYSHFVFFFSIIDIRHHQTSSSSLSLCLCLSLFVMPAVRYALLPIRLSHPAPRFGWLYVRHNPLGSFTSLFPSFLQPDSIVQSIRHPSLDLCVSLHYIFHPHPVHASLLSLPSLVRLGPPGVIGPAASYLSAHFFHTYPSQLRPLPYAPFCNT
jgi:hypothetical protein